MRRAEIVDALLRGGLELTDATDELATIHVDDGQQGLVIRYEDEILVQLSTPLDAGDLAGLARVAVELTTLWSIVRAYEDCESAGVIAANTAHDAHNALVPVVFAAEALARRYPGAEELTSLLVRGCKRVTSILQRIAPIDGGTPSAPIHANTVIGELHATLRAMAHRAELATRLEIPLPPIAIERAVLERMLLTLVANAAAPARNSTRLVIATSSRRVTTAAAPCVPAGDWVVIEVDDDGDSIDGETRERALHPTFTATPSPPSTGAGLPSVVRLTRAAGGYVCIDNQQPGMTIGIWLPRAS